MRRVNKRISILVIAMFLMLGIGYAAISTTLTITGNAGIRGDSNNFQNNVFFYNADLSSNAISSSDLDAAKPKINGREMSFSVPSSSPLKNIGDKIVVTYTIKNESNYNAIIAVPTVTSSSSDFLDYFTVTHSRTGNLNLGINQVSSFQTLTLTLKKTYADTLAKQFDFTVSIIATADSGTIKGANNNNGVVKTMRNFEDDDWRTIVNNVRNGDGDLYELGSTKCVRVSGYNRPLYSGNYPSPYDNGCEDLDEYRVRIVNNSTPSECQNSNFSQSGCGFVLEFMDNISEYHMDDNQDGFDDNKGGWANRQLRDELNVNIFNALPWDLQNSIIYTDVVSGYNSFTGDTSNFNTNDLLFLLSAHEIYDNIGIATNISDNSTLIDIDTAYYQTRQLDYYKSNGVTLNNPSGAKKYGYDMSVWLRTPYNCNFSNYFYLKTDGDGSISLDNTHWDNGIAPAFRIG